jgi:O-antigen/teichoic acid export membrane protein
VLPVALGAALLPRLTKLRQENPPEYGRQARRWAAGLVGAGAGAATLLMLAGPVVVPVVFGPAYAAAADVLAVHAWSLPFVFLVSLRTRLLVIEAGTRWVLLMSLVTAALNLGANLLLIPRMGGLAAAWATAGAWAGSALVAPWLFAPTRALMLRLIRGAPPVAAA